MPDTALLLSMGYGSADDRLLARAVKRAIDVSLALILLTLLAPLMVAIALIIAAEGHGQIVFGHPRIGRFGASFRCLKFRTMIVDANRRLEILLLTDPALAAEWAMHRKLDRDPRITPIGRFLRATSLDELPQLINVLRGDMSLVGPRPVTAEELLRYGRCARAYKSVRPGITGPWQIGGRNRLSYADRVRLDDHYARTWGVGHDLLLLAKTPAAVLSRRGAH